MFERTMAELIKGIRTQKKEESRRRFISGCLQDIREELKSTSPVSKVNAIQKLVYLQMLGYDTSFAAFQAVMLCSSPTFGQKRLGYLCCSVTLYSDTDVLTLMESLLKKDFASNKHFETGLALNCLSNVVNADLARNLSPVVIGMSNSSSGFVRKKATLLLYQMIRVAPDIVRSAFPRLRERLEDSDSSVCNAAVNVICECCAGNPKPFLPLVPPLFKLFSAQTTNWMLIKLVRCFSLLCPHEPRLGKKLLEPLTNIINTTTATSLLYEAINCCSIGLSSYKAVIQLCMEKLKVFASDSDTNLKYLGLLGMEQVMLSHPKIVAEQSDVIVTCLNDSDSTIRHRALSLVGGMVSRRNIKSIIQTLLEHVHSGEPRDRELVIETILNICSRDSFKLVSDFGWYLSILSEIVRLPRGTRHAPRIASQLLEVGVRVESSRGIAVEIAARLLGDGSLSQSCDVSSDVLVACAFIVAEFCFSIEEGHQALLSTLLGPATLNLPPSVQSSFVHNALKVLARIAGSGVGGGSGSVHPTIVRECLGIVKSRLPSFLVSVHLEVQERANTLNGLLECFEGSLSELGCLFAGELLPPHPKAQRKVPLPPGLDLDEWINEPEMDSEDEMEELRAEARAEREREEALAGGDDPSGISGSGLGDKMKSAFKQESRKRRKERKERRKNDPFYLHEAHSSSDDDDDDDGDNDDDLDKEHLDDETAELGDSDGVLEEEGGSFSSSMLSVRRGGAGTGTGAKSKKQKVIVNLESAMPEGVGDESSEEEEEQEEAEGASVHDAEKKKSKREERKKKEPRSYASPMDQLIQGRGDSDRKSQSRKHHHKKHSKHSKTSKTSKESPEVTERIRQNQELASVLSGLGSSSSSSSSSQQQHIPEDQSTPVQETKHRRHRHGHGKHSSKSKHSKVSSKASDSGTTTTTTTTSSSISFSSVPKTVYSDEFISLTQCILTTFEEKHQSRLVCRIDINASGAMQTIEKGNVIVTSTLSVMVGSALGEHFDIASGGAISLKLPIQLRSIVTRPVRLRATIGYSMAGERSTGSFAILLHPSDFVIPVPPPSILNVDESKGEAHSALVSESCTPQRLANKFHLKVLEQTSTISKLGASLVNSTGTNIITLVQSNGAGKVEVTVWSEVVGLGSALLNEISAAF